MDLTRFLDLFISEAREHTKLLGRGILALERGGGAEAVDEAFRAAHTLKGLAAAMGYNAVAQLAHALEDELDGIRAGRLQATGERIDGLLQAADELEIAIDHAVATQAPQIDGGAAAPAAPAAAKSSRTFTSPVADDELAVLVRLNPDAAIKAARAMLVIRGIEMGWRVLRTEPATFDDDFDGEFRIIVPKESDAGAIEAAILAAGEVASVEVDGGNAAPAPAAPVRTPVREAPGAARTQQVRVDPRKLDLIADGIGELSVLQARLEQEPMARGAVSDMIDRLGTVLAELQHSVLSVRMVPVSEAFERFPRLVRDTARKLGKQLDFEMLGAEIQLDRSILDEMVDPLIHLLRNAVDHGIESPEEREITGKPPRARLQLRAERVRTSVRIVVQDDGRGIKRERVIARARAAGLLAPDDEHGVDDGDLFRLISSPGFSTAEAVTDTSGRGVGLDVVVNRIRAIGGAIDMTSVEGEGTTFTLRLPITLALGQALRVRVGGDDYAIPLTHIAEAVELASIVVEREGSEHIVLRGEDVPLVRLGDVLGGGGGRETAAVVAELGERRTALAVDALVGHEQILVKTFDAAVGTLPIFSGATLLADGRPALVLDPLSVI